MDLMLPEFNTGLFDLPASGIPQGSPLSPILYIIYNHELIELVTSRTNKSLNILFVDDSNILVAGASPEANAAKIAEIYSEICIPWARRHTTIFNPVKFKVMHFVRKAKPTNQPAWNLKCPVHLEGLPSPIVPEERLRDLGIMLNSLLSWEQHRLFLVEKPITKLRSFGKLAASTWGLTTVSLRNLFTTTVLSSILFACSVWYIPDRGWGWGKQEKKILATLQSIQKEGLRLISCTFRSAAGSALCIETFTPPIKLDLERRIYKSLVQITTSPLYDTIKETRQLIRATVSNCRAPRWHSPLVKLLRRARENKTLPCRLKNLERKVAFPCAPWYVPPEIVIAPTREVSIAIYDAVIQCPDTLAIYTDASGIKGLVGAVAVIPATKQISHLHMGQLKTHNSVYGGELQGIRLGY